MAPDQHIKFISNWINTYARKNKFHALTVGISGGIDSSVVSTLCAMTGLLTTVVSMPIKQNKSTHKLSLAHAHWLAERFSNVKHININLTPTFKKFEKLFVPALLNQQSLALANSRSRLRMMTLYQLAQAEPLRGLVVGTGNRVEDFGVGFFTKYGDGGVDISPIADCMKTTVWAMGKELGILRDIITAVPTDGLWDDGRSDEQQLGMSYEDLELAMTQDEHKLKVTDARLKRNLNRYRELRSLSLHKLQPIPICIIKEG